MTCHTCHRPMRPYTATIKDQPGTVRMQSPTECNSCWRARRRVKRAVQEVTVPVRTFIRAATYRQLLAHADQRGTTVTMLLSQLADAAIREQS